MDNFIVISNHLKDINVYERNSLKHVMTLDENGKELEEETNYPLCMQPLGGDLLITSSKSGVKLCVWNVRTGMLLKYHNDADEPCGYDDFPECDCQSMTYLSKLNAIVTGNAYLCTWIFPKR